MRIFALAIALIAGTVFLSPVKAVAQEAVVAVVNDHPITNFDVEQRIKLLGLLGVQDPNKLSRKAAANSLINDYVKIAEAKQAKLDPSDSEVEDRLRSMAGALKTDRPGLTTKLNGMGLTEDALRQQVLAQMSFARLLQVKYHVKVEVDQAAVDKKFTEVKADIQGRVAKVESDPRRQPITVLQLQEINFPVEGADPQLLQSRAIEAGQVVQKMKSCATIKQATAGIFNVQIGKKIEADSRRLPPPLMAQLKQRGVGKAIGPMRYAKGIQILGYCGTRTITPPPLKYQLPSRQQIETLAINQKYEEVDQKYTSLMRKNAIIEYKDPSYAQ